jgi:hypothetical protein
LYSSLAQIASGCAARYGQRLCWKTEFELQELSFINDFNKISHLAQPVA